MRRIAAILVSLAVTACSNAGPAVLKGPDANARRVLLVGNSHTHANDLPGMLATLGQLSGTVLRAETVAFGGYALEDHWVQGDALRALERDQWDFVVLQQGPSSLPESQAHLAFWTMKFAPLIREAGAELVLYQIWPSAPRRLDAAHALKSYRDAADSVDAILAPAGDAFTTALDSYPEIDPYATDGIHASIQGTYLAALVLLARINGTDPQQLPPRIPQSKTDSVIVRKLQQAARQALARNPTRP